MSDEKSVILRAYPGHGRPYINAGHTGTSGAEQLRMTIKDDRIIVATHTLLLGVSTAGKEWSRWETKQIVTFKVNKLKSGEQRLNVYLRQYHKSGGRTISEVRNISTQMLTVSNFLAGNFESTGAWEDGYTRKTVHDEVIDLLKRHNLYVYDGDDKQSDVYRSLFPAINLWHPNGRLQTMATRRLTEGLRQSTIENFVSAEFGKTRYRKDLVKSLLGTSLRRIDAVVLFTGLVPVDWQINALRDETKAVEPGRSPELNRESDRAFRYVFREMTDARKRNLMDSVLTENNYYLINDTFRMLRDRRERGETAISDAMRQSRTVTELHDSLARHPYRGQIGAGRIHAVVGVNHVHTPYIPPPPPANRVIESNEYIESINAINLEGYRFVCAVDTDQMNDWSDTMGNCIRSYADRAVNHRGIYIGVYRDDKLYANIELAAIVPDAKSFEGSFRLNQILGRFNKSLPENERNDVIDALRTAVYIDETKIKEAWGGGNYIAGTGMIHNFIGGPTNIAAATTFSLSIDHNRHMQQAVFIP